MQVVIDANVYIFALGLAKTPSCEKLLQLLIENPLSHSLRISRNIVREVRRNLSPEDFEKFIVVINLLTKIDEEFFVPFEIGAKYESKGLKPADALIAAYTEWTGADVLVIENRHFLVHHGDLPFKVLTAEKCLKFLL